MGVLGVLRTQRSKEIMRCYEKRAVSNREAGCWL